MFVASSHDVDIFISLIPRPSNIPGCITVLDLVHADSSALILFLWLTLWLEDRSCTGIGWSWDLDRVLNSMLLV